VETQPNTIVLVAKLNSTASSQTLLDGNGATNRHIIRVHHTGQWTIYAGSFVESVGQTINTSPHIFRALFDGANSKLWIDDTLVISGNAGSASLGGLTVGRWSDAGSDFASMDWGELLVYAGDISSTWATLRDHLEAKWGL